MENLNLAQKEYLVDTEYNADLVGLLLGDEYFIEKLANRNLPLVEKIFKGLKNLNKKSAAVDKASAKYLNKLVNKFEKALDNAKGGVKISELGGTDEEKAEQGEVKNVRFSKMNNESLESNVDNVLEMSDEEALKNKQEGNFISIMKHTPGVILQNVIEAENHEVIMRFDAFYLAVRKDGILEGHYHNMGEFMKDLPQRLSEPLAILKMDNGRINIFAEFTSEKNKNGIASVELNTVKDINSKNQKYNLVVSVFNAKDNYIKNNISKHGVSIEYKKEDLTQVNPQLYKWLATINDKSSNNIISENSKKSNTFDKKIDDERKSISKSVDSEGNSLSAEQAEYFKDSKVRDENGNLLVVYHGTRKADFTVFKRNVNFFTDNVEMAESYSPNGEKYKGYLNISNPLVIDACAEKWSRIPIDYELKGLLDAFGSSTFKENGKWRTTPADIAAAIEEAIDEGEVDYDGIIIKNIDDTGSYYKNSDKIVANDYIVFKSNQFKNADNTAPTDNPDIRYSKSKSERFTTARETEMRLAEELVKLYDEGTLSASEAQRKLKALGYQTGITADNVLEVLDELIPELREYATSERAAYRAWRKKEDEAIIEDSKHLNSDNSHDEELIDRALKEVNGNNNSSATQNGTSKAPSPTSEGKKATLRGDENVISSEEYARREREAGWDYWLSEVDRREGSVRKLKNGKIKVGLAQTANEVKLTKFINNKIMDKSYSNENVKSIIDKILSNSDIWGADEDGSYMAKLKGKDLINAKKRLWAALNTAPEGERIGPALDIADFIVTHGMIEETVEITEDVINAQYIIDTLEPYKRKIDISHIKGDIEAVFDTDRSPFGLWAQKKSDTSRPFTADEVGQALEDAGIILGGERGKLINEADIFIAMHKLYTEAQAIIKAATPTKNDIIGAYDAKEAYEIKQKIAREILRSYDEYGKETSFARLEKKFRGEIASLKKRVSEVYELNRAKNEMLYLAGKFQDKKKGKFHNATQAQNKALNGIISVLSKLKYRSDINKSSSRALLDELAKWYTEDNPLLAGGAVDKKTSESKGFYSPYIKELIDYFRLDEASVNDKYFENKRKILEMEPTFAVSGNEFAKGEVDLFTQVNDYFKTFNNQVHNEEIGDVIIDRRGIKDDVAHGIGRKKAATFAAVPDVIKNGKVVDYQTNWKNRGYDTAVIAAPITIAGEKHYMGVVVIQNKENNRFYVHEVVEIKKEGAQPFKTGLAEKNSNAGGDTPSVISILQDLAKINTLNENNAELSLDELHAINKILAHMNFVVENFGKIWRRGKWVEAGDVAEKDLEIFKSAVQNQTVITRLVGNKFTVIILFYNTGQKSCVFSL